MSSRSFNFVLLSFFISCSLLHRTNGSICYNEKLVESRTEMQQVETGTGSVSDIPAKLSDGQSITVICKNTRHVFVNQIRSKPGVDTDLIDEMLAVNPNSLHLQKGEIAVRCEGGALKPDIFTGISTWCAEGCSPLPENMLTFHQVTYSTISISISPTTPPILKSIRGYIIVSCRESYAPAVLQTGAQDTRCLDDGYDSPVTKLVTCVSGCKDITRTFMNGELEAKPEPSEVEGAPTFNVGAVISVSCRSGYHNPGERFVTCTSDQEWSPVLPKCVSDSERSRSVPQTIPSRLLLIIIFVYKQWME